MPRSTEYNLPAFVGNSGWQPDRKTALQNQSKVFILALHIRLMMYISRMLLNTEENGWIALRDVSLKNVLDVALLVAALSTIQVTTLQARSSLIVWYHKN